MTDYTDEELDSWYDFPTALMEHQDNHKGKPFHMVIISVCADGTYYATDTGGSGLSDDLICNCLDDLSHSLRKPKTAKDFN